jgi:hypothetical protein
MQMPKFVPRCDSGQLPWTGGGFFLPGRKGVWQSSGGHDQRNHVRRNQVIDLPALSRMHKSHDNVTVSEFDGYCQKGAPPEMA